MITYQTKAKRLSGSSYTEVYRLARAVFTKIKRRTKRKPYIRSVYFKKGKVFFDYFWPHLKQKSWRERTSRLSYFACAIEMIENSHQEPIVKINPNKKSEKLYRFTGETKNRERFCVQIKEVTRTKSKYLMSVFAPKNQKSSAR